MWDWDDALDQGFRKPNKMNLYNNGSVSVSDIFSRKIKTIQDSKFIIFDVNPMPVIIYAPDVKQLVDALNESSIN